MRPIVQISLDLTKIEEALETAQLAIRASTTLEIAMDIVRPAGWISKVGWGPQPLGFNLDPLVQKNVTLQGRFSHN